jgi:hypothetical protein
LLLLVVAAVVEMVIQVQVLSLWVAVEQVD